MKNVFVAVAAFATSAAATGSAIVLNNCGYDVYLRNTPAADGGATEVDKTLSSGDQYSQVYTELTNGCGWSLKLAKDTSDFDTGDSENIMQYEYTYLNDGTIWFDLSNVNGNPWNNSDWDIHSDNAQCDPEVRSYLYPTDDKNGMQDCADSASITVTLCNGTDLNGAPSASSSVYSASSTSAAASSTSLSAYATSTSLSAYASTTKASASSSEAASSSTEAAASTSEAVSTTAASSTSTRAYHGYSHTWENKIVTTSAAVSATTFATAVSSTVVASASTEDAGNVVIVTVTDVATAYATAIETVSPAKKRDAHQHRHAARHPHAGRA